MDENRRSGQFVTPGQKLGVIEEFMSNSGTYEEAGEIHSNNVGFVLMDLANKKVSVYTVVHNLNFPKVGSVVMGKVTNVQNSQTIIRIRQVEKKLISSFFTGMIHISDISFNYVDNMFDEFKVGDMVRAKVISTKNRIFHLSTKEETLGVTYTQCSKCGGKLRESRRNLKCERCGYFAKRKFASDYGSGNT